MKKIFYNTLLIFIFLTVYSIYNIQYHNNTKMVNLEISDITNIYNSYIYLLNKDNLLVKVDIYLDKIKKEEKVKQIINYLKIKNSNNTFRGYIPNNTKINNVEIKDKTLFLDLSHEYLNNNVIDNSIVKCGLIRSLLEIEGIDDITITIDNMYYKGYTKNINKNIAINPIYSINNRYNVDKVFLYYLDNSNNYYIPVTKYINNDREEVEVIIDELKTPSNNLISTLHHNIKLLDYKIEDKIMILNFNNLLLNKNNNIQNKTINLISYSIFDNYPDINIIMFEVNNKTIKQIKKS